MEIGLAFSFLTAIFDSIKDVFSKKNLRLLDEYIVAFSSVFYALPFLLILLLFTDIPSIGESFWLALSINGSLNLMVRVLYMKALKHSDLSLVVPMVTFTPLFLLITSPLIVNEFPTRLGVIGILLIVFGSYILKINKQSKGILAPFKSLFTEKGPRLMLLVAFLWSITSNYDKIGVQNSSPILWTVSVYTFMMVGLFFVIIVKKRSFKALFLHKKTLLPIGIFTAGMITSQMIAISTTLVAYVISIKRTSAVLSVFFGYFIFKEKGIKQRLLASLIMIGGVVLITLF